MITNYSISQLPLNALGFQENEDSPQESSSGGKISATRTFRGPSKNRFAFIRFVTGYASITNSDTIQIYEPISYPDNPSLMVSDWRITNCGRPVDWIDGTPVTDLSRVVTSEASNDGLECQIEITYTSPDSDNGGKGGKGGQGSKDNNRNDPRMVEPEKGTFLSVSETWSTEDQDFDTPGFHMYGEVETETGANGKPVYMPEIPDEDPEHGPESTDDVPKTSNVETEKKPPKTGKWRCPIEVHSIEVTWSSAVAPDWSKIYSYMGRLNRHEWFGYPRGAVRLSGATKNSRLTTSTVAHPETVVSEHFLNGWVYDITFSFVAKTVPSAGVYRNVKNGRVGVYNRVFCISPIPIVRADGHTFVRNSKQHWWLTANKFDKRSIGELEHGQTFNDLFKYDSATFSNIIYGGN